MSKFVRILGGAFMACALLVACSDDDDVAGGGGTPAATVRVRGTAGYSMDSVTINAGETVEWVWDTAGHTVTSCNIVGGLPACTPNGQFDSGVLSAGQTFRYTFTTPGLYGYFCTQGTDCSVSFESAVVQVN